MATHQTPPGGGQTPTEHVHVVNPKPGLSRLEQALLPEEGVAEFRALRLGIHEDLRPRGALEMRFVDRFVMNHWRMERAAIMEAELIARRRAQATAWENPRRVRTAPTAGAVWADDQQHYGGAWEKLAKQEYRLSLEATRILRELARKQKARQADDGAGYVGAFGDMLDALSEPKPRAPAGEAKEAAVEPRIRQHDADGGGAGVTEPTRPAGSVPPADAAAPGEATDPEAESGILQNELPPVAGKTNSPTNEAKPISRSGFPAGDPRPIPDTSRMTRIDNIPPMPGNNQPVNSRQTAPYDNRRPLRQAADPEPGTGILQNEPPARTWVGSGAGR